MVRHEVIKQIPPAIGAYLLRLTFSYPRIKKEHLKCSFLSALAAMYCGLMFYALGLWSSSYRVGHDSGR